MSELEKKDEELKEQTESLKETSEVKTEEKEVKSEAKEDKKETVTEEKKEESTKKEPFKNIHVIVVTSGKGGVGKTTSSAAIATGIAKKGHKTAV
ncbi:ArsA-related P-loop ATPase, partial [Succinivibrio sp.]